MWLDGFAIAVLAGFAVLGGYRGGLASGLRLGSLLAAYILAASLGPWVAGLFAFSRVAAVPLGGVAVFVAAYAALGMLTWVFLNLEKRYRGDYPRTAFDRGTGVVFGLGRGALVVLLIGWLSLWVDALRVAGPLSAMPPMGRSTVSGVTQRVVAAGVDYGVGNDTASARLTKEMASRPAETLTSMRDLMEDAHVRALQDDGLFWSYVSNGNYDAALNQGSFLGIAYDDSLRERFAEVGVVTREAAHDPRLFRNKAREVLEEVGPRIRSLKDDPELQKLLADPAVRRALENGDTLALVQHSGFQRLVERVGGGAE